MVFEIIRWDKFKNNIKMVTPHKLFRFKVYTYSKTKSKSKHATRRAENLAELGAKVRFVTLMDHVETKDVNNLELLTNICLKRSEK
jgi:hypothetical protein